MNLLETVYELVLRLGRRAVLTTGLGPGKLRSGLEGRRGLGDRIERWARQARGDGPLVWVHAPSVGEGLQTGPVIEALRESRPDLTIFYTYFSPSARSLPDRLPVDGADYMPLDIESDLEPVVNALRPSAIVLGKADVWPTLTRLAEERGIPVILVNATLAPNSSRLRWPARRVLRGAHARLSAVGAISEADAERLGRLGVPADRIEVTGDARFDQVRARADAIDRAEPPVALLLDASRPTLVAGSTWPEGEVHLLPALAGLPRLGLKPRTVIAPHEPTPGRLDDLESRLVDLGLGPVRLSAVESGAPPADVVLVDRVGVLAELYAVGDVAYVGGGFGTDGLHSVLEPAALGLPVLFGPNHRNAREAGELVARGSALIVEDAKGLQDALVLWLRDEDARRAAGAAARAYVDGNLGGGRRNADLVLRALQGA